MPKPRATDVMLSRHFSVREMCRSDIAQARGIDNTPDPDALNALSALCLNVLEPLRVHLGQPIAVNSGYRSEPVNALVRGTTHSDHRYGRAADIECASINNLELARMIVALDLPFDQLILEFYDDGDPHSGWVHVSHRAGSNNRREVLTRTRAGYARGLP